MDKIAQAMKRAGFPSSDGYDLPTSKKAFPDGAHYRVEISGIETPKVLSAAIDEARKQAVPFHRAVSVVRGASMLTREQLNEFAVIAHDKSTEGVLRPKYISAHGAPSLDGQALLVISALTYARETKTLEFVKAHWGRPGGCPALAGKS